MSWVSYADAPAGKTIFRHLCDTFGRPKPKRRYEAGMKVPGLSFDHENVAREMGAFFARYGISPWRSLQSGQSNLMGASLYYNPDAPEDEWICGSFGHPRYQEFGDYYKAVSQDDANLVKGDYLDSYSFRRRHFGIQAVCPELNALLDRFKTPIVRATARLVHLPGWAGTSMGGFHFDESPDCIMRVNLAVVNNGDFGLQYQHNGDIEMPRSGDHSVVCADHAHRVYVPHPTIHSRLHLVIGVVPWYDYDPVADAWKPNQYHGQIHPFDMVKEGLIFA